MTKTLTLTCARCKKVKKFEGENVDEILSAIDASGWRDMPDPYGHGIVAYCPPCDEEMDRLFRDAEPE